MDALRNASLLNGQIAVCQYQLGLMQHEVRLPLRLLPLADAALAVELEFHVALAAGA
jgi:hypothetical protein